MLQAISYVKARLAESGTYAAIGVAVTGGSALPHPYNYIFIALGILGALSKTS